MKRPWLLYLLTVMILLAACGDESGSPTATSTTPAGNEPTPTISSIEDVPPPSPAATTTSRPTATPAPTPVPPAPTLSIADQSLEADGLLIVEQVISLAPGWVVVYADDDGRPGEILGFTPVSTGESNDVVVEIDPYLATPRLHLLLHTDGGQPKEFDFPGPDEPFTNEDGPISMPFDIEIGVFVPGLSVADQDVDMSGQVVIDQVVSDGSGWIAVHADQAGEPGPVIGQTPLTEGENNNVIVSFNWQQATPQLHAVIYHDAGEAGMFEAPNPDRPVSVSGIPIRAAFSVTLPPDVLVINQPVINEQVEIERAVVNGPAWLTVYTDADGQPNLLIGQALLEPGINTGVIVPVDESAVTPVLHVVLYEDNDPAGEYNFPGNDLVIRYEGRFQTFSFRTEAGNYLITNDQNVSENNLVMVPLVVTEVPVWVTIQSEIEGAPGAVIGSTWVPAGVHRDVVIEIDPAQATITLFATLIQDAGVEQEFEFPGGPDLPLQRNRVTITAPFTVLVPDPIEED